MIFKENTHTFPQKLILIRYVEVVLLVPLGKNNFTATIPFYVCIFGNFKNADFNHVFVFPVPRSNPWVIFNDSFLAISQRLQTTEQQQLQHQQANKKKSPKFFIRRSAVPTGAISHLSRENHAQFQKEKKNREKETTQKKTALYARGNGILLCPAVWPGVCAACRER